MSFVLLSCKFKSLKGRVRHVKAMELKQFTDSSTQTDVGPDNIAIDAPVDLPVPTKKIQDATWMMTNANEQHIVLSIDNEDIQQSANEVTSKGGYELLCSYSWKQMDSPTIYVPGTPPTFTFHDPKTEVIELAADAGLHWHDQHAERVPTHQFKPVFQALAALQSEERFDAVDIVVNRGSLQQLLILINNKSNRAFHLDLDIGNPMIRFTLDCVTFRYAISSSAGCE